ncbi:Magnesium and cobalt efflux protein CorC [Aquisphaera giovannonii]|uniref:Magnesium and cobalt efflux protein CorC n=1 Tax=Aquisphaera giovannonii TaxID=406548 RepID=A0A5B9W1D9_9BACT|nr:hemolysin family protein [Aquisphaera giovannonii]QEH34373.1 Magnesium and cobalt efflux protein CorC [Aquisphaera giovannonii]
MDYSHFLIIAGLILINAYFVAAEFALVKVRTSQIEQLVEEGNWAARMTSRALDKLDVYLSASQIGITVASLALGRAIEGWIEPMVKTIFHRLGALPAVGAAMGWLGRPFHVLLGWMGIDLERLAPGLSAGIVPVAAISLVTFLHMALGEQAPKTLAIRVPLALALITAPPLVMLASLFWPVIWLLNTASNLTLRILGLGRASSHELTHTEEELRHILLESTEGGHLSRRERVMIENVLNLEEKTARRIMVPRPDIVYLSLSRPPEENLRLARQAGHTRLPLCEDDLTTVIGIIHVKDVFRAGASHNGRLDLRQLARKVPFLPVTLRLDQLLVEFQKNRVHLAMLLDEYGSVVGMVTMENVLEELVGPIQDEFDRESPPIMEAGDGAFEVEASCPLDVLAEQVGMTPPETDVETAGGLVLDILGRLARTGDSVDVGSHRLTVIQADPTRIRKLRVEPIAVQGQEEAGREPHPVES